jgi:hypothetical protein
MLRFSGRSKVIQRHGRSVAPTDVPHLLLPPSAGPVARQLQDAFRLDIKVRGDTRAAENLVSVDLVAGDTASGGDHTPIAPL